WWRAGQTIGMVAWRLRVVDMQGGRISFLQGLLRTLIAIVSWLPAGLGFLWVLVDRDNRAWHDAVSRTQLVFEDRLSARAPEPP
ncbi:MAG: RDD family protein, partial [Gammaproteobacteria bacterium]|nr:RDD family protein [Gammaproteobacteria bacterium]